MISFKDLLNGFLVKRAIKKAERIYKQTRYHCLVVNWGKFPRIFRRTDLKKLIKAKQFKKYITIQDFEKSALYKTW